MPTWKLPWNRPTGPHAHFLDDGPPATLEFDAGPCKFRVTPTAMVGFDTGRRRYHVECLTCRHVIHEATTGATQRVLDHLNGDEVLLDSTFAKSSSES